MNSWTKVLTLVPRYELLYPSMTYYPGMNSLTLFPGMNSCSLVWTPVPKYEILCSEIKFCPQIWKYVHKNGSFCNDKKLLQRQLKN
jgi:hypothetical protein